MSRRVIDFRGTHVPLLDIASYARRGPGRRDRLSSVEVGLISRTVHRTPEVMVKVLTRGTQNLGAVRRHLEYLDRHGELEIETDDGQTLSGDGLEGQLLEDWDLDVEEYRRTADLQPRSRPAAPKLVHKLLFSMPPGTPPDKVLEAVKNFAREEFALKHRYAMVLHTDEPHPHVHMVVKAMSEQGVRLNIRKPTLRAWRSEFARHLRTIGVEANATERAVRGGYRVQKLDGIYRASLRGHSTHMHQRVEVAARHLSRGNMMLEPDKEKLIGTRNNVLRGWWTVSDILVRQRKPGLAELVRQFARKMPPPLTESEHIAAALTRGQPSREKGSPGFAR